MQTFVSNLPLLHGGNIFKQGLMRAVNERFGQGLCSDDRFTSHMGVQHFGCGRDGHLKFLCNEGRCTRPLGNMPINVDRDVGDSHQEALIHGGSR